MNKKLIFPNLKFETFFSGKVEAVGHMILFYPRKRVKNIKANFYGHFLKKTLTLKEEYFEDTIKTNRIWKFKKISDDKYVGSEKNVPEPIKLIVHNNYLEMCYKFKTKYKFLSFNVVIKDSMYLMNNTYLINKSAISKFGITIAETILLYKKL